MPGRKIQSLPLADQVQPSDVVVGVVGNQTSRIPISSIQGTSGLMGAQGAQGIEGPQGAQGIEGPQGAQGIEGPQGAQGVPGGGSGSINIEQRYFDYVNNAELYGTNGLTEVSDLGDDDSEWIIELPFEIQFLGQTYSQVWINSNSYITFASVSDNSPIGYPAYWPISPATLAVPSIIIGAADRSISKFYYGLINDNRFVIRYEGFIKNYGGNLNAPLPRIWEAWFYVADPGVISIVVDTGMSTGGVWGLHDGAKWIDVYEGIPRQDQNSDQETINGIDIYSKSPQTADTIKFIGTGVETYIEDNKAFVEINPLQGIVNLDLNINGDAVITSSGYGLILRSNHDDDVTIDSEGGVNINAKSPDNAEPGDGRNININAGDGGGAGNNDGGSINITAGTSTNSGVPGQVNITVNNKDWGFNAEGDLLLPSGGDIKDSNGNSVLGANNIMLNFDGGASATVFSPSDIILDGSNSSLGLSVLSITNFSPAGIEANVTVNITNNGGSSITSRGIVWSTSHNPTISDNVVSEGGTGSGIFTMSTGFIPEGTNYIRAYATNTNGTSYSDEHEFFSFVCLIKGTLITLSDGSTKKIEDIEYSDSLLVWNFDAGKFDSAKPAFISIPSPPTNEYNIIKFSDGSELRTVLKDLGHRIFNEESGMFTYPMTEDTPIGTTTFKHDGAKVSLVSKRIEKQKGIFYNIITERHINVFANGILTSARLNNIYPIEGMKFVKSEINNRSREEFHWISDELFEGFRLEEQPKEFDSIQDNLRSKINLMKPKS